MEWIDVKEKMPLKWSYVECKNSDKVYKNALYQFEGRFIDMDSKATIVSGAVLRDRIHNVTHWRDQDESAG